MFIVLFVWVAFEEQHTFPKPFLVLIFIYIVLETGSHWMWHYTGPGPIPTFMRVMQVVEIGLTIFALILLWNGKEEDLVETRAKLRNLSILGIASLTLLILFMHLVTEHIVPDGVDCSL